jgi:hypothetical protein
MGCACCGTDWADFASVESGLHAGSATLFDAVDTFDFCGGGLLSRSGGAKKTSGEE